MRTRLFQLFGFGILFVCLLFGEANGQSRSPIDGITEYMVQNRRGQAFHLDGHFVYFLQRSDSTLPKGPLSDSTKAALFNTLTLTGGTYVVRDTMVTSTIEYSKNPRLVGQKFRWSYGFVADTFLWRVYNDSGRVTSSGRSKWVRRFK